jgi:3-methylcrotonyl-CoA carboxylase alpha subunit
MFKRILIANRGEIACRIIETARKLGVETVAVYSDADKNSRHVAMSDQALHIGGAAPLESYLRMDRIVEAALKSGAQGIHPGYGFLSQNGRFADLCDSSKVKFIGPSGQSMDKMGSKSESKDIMIRAGVPVTPGYHGPNQDPQFLLEEARKIKYPVMIKAVMGGGGKGMKVAWNDKEFAENLQSAKREALKSFGDDRMLLEKYVQRPRHYEIQVFGDDHGNYVYLFERDCSIQRRHQKVIEEAPSGLSPEQREKMGRTACEAARAVGYVNAGTVEFLYDCESKEFYFMEMNTRLQVEHPVTEMITGLDLVEWQLKIASGQRLPKLQDELRINGHAIEARVYSEDPFTFLPGRGTVDYYREPANVRIDSGVVLGSEVGIWYDPMISKLIVWGQDRDIAVQKIRKAISEYKIGGLVTNLPLLKRLADHPKFEDFSYDLKFIEEYEKDLIPKSITLADDTLIAAAFAAVNSFHDKVAPRDPARRPARALQLQTQPRVQEPLQPGDHQRAQPVGRLRHGSLR